MIEKSKEDLGDIFAEIYNHIETLEKKVAALEKQLQEQPKIIQKIALDEMGAVFAIGSESADA